MTDLSLSKRHFSVKNYLCYFHYLRENFPQIDIPRLVSECGLPFEYFTNQDNWVSVTFDRRFTKACIEKTGQTDLCRQVGTLAATKPVVGLARYLTLKYATSLDRLYRRLPKTHSLSSHVTQLRQVAARRGGLVLEFGAYGLNGLTEDERRHLKENLPFILENTMSQLAAWPGIHGLPPANVSCWNKTPDAEFPVYELSIRYTLPRTVLATVQRRWVTVMGVDYDGLDAQQAALHSIVDGMDLGLLVFDRGANGEWASAPFLSNRAFRELDGKISPMLGADGLAQRIRQAHRHTFDSVVQKKLTVTQANVEYRAADGTQSALYVTARLFPVDPDKVGVILENTTVTEHARQATELERAKAVESAKFAALAGMTADIAHELNNPLSIIKGHAVQLLKSKTATPKERRAFDIISITVDRMAENIRGTLKYSRDTSTDPIDVIPLSKIISDSLELCRARVGYHGCTLEVSGVKSDQLLSCRDVEICRALISLLNNAFDAVSVVDEKRVSLTVTEDAEILSIAVEDSGPGIPDHVAERLFQPFFTTKGGKGTGLGLSVARNIAECHRGTLTLESARPTRFVLRLPKFRAAEAA